jgi:hypothetical protein
VVTVRLRPFTALYKRGLSGDTEGTKIETYAARVGRARFAGGESDLLDPALSSLSSSEAPRFRLDYISKGAKYGHTVTYFVLFLDVSPLSLSQHQ